MLYKIMDGNVRLKLVQIYDDWVREMPILLCVMGCELQFY